MLRNIIKHNRYLVGVNSNALSEFSCLIVTIFLLAVTMRSSLSWKVLMVKTDFVFAFGVWSISWLV